MVSGRAGGGQIAQGRGPGQGSWAKARQRQRGGRTERWMYGQVRGKWVGAEVVGELGVCGLKRELTCAWIEG